MSGPIKTLVVLEGGIDPDLVQSILPTGADIHIVGLVEGLEDAWHVLEETPTDLLVVACAGNSDRALYLIDGAVRQQPDRPVVVLSEASANGFVRRVFAAGADDLLSFPQTVESVHFALQKAVARRHGGSMTTGAILSPMVCVLGPKGGTGKTLVTCNLAIAFARAGKRVAIVDLDLQFGDVGLSLGLSPDRTIYDLAKSGGSLDADKASAYLTAHSSGVGVLLAPTRPDHGGLITSEFLRDVFTALRSSHDFVIVDTPPGFTPEVIATIDTSSDVCMVAMLDSLSLKNTKLGFETLELMGYDKARIKLVLNRADTRVGITADDVAAIVGRAPDVLLPSDRDIPLSVNEAVPIVVSKERSSASQAFKALAREYIDRSSGAGMPGAPKSSRAKRSLLRKGA